MDSWFIWIAMALLAAVAAIPVLAALYRALAVPASPAEHTAAVYRDQLAEVERDLASGILAPAEAEAARTEIARRLIKAGGEAGEAAAARCAGGRLRLAGVAIVAMPVAAFLFYLSLGSPEYPDQPLADRVVETQDIAAMIAAVEARLQAEPDDGTGWDVIAPVYLRLGRDADAAIAYANAIRLLGSTDTREIGLGEALMRAAGGIVTPDAEAAFVRAAALAADDARPRFYLALAAEQQGRIDEALAAYRALLADAPAGAPWAEVVAGQIAALEAEPAPAIPGPSAEDIEAAGEMTPEDRQAMIEGMVASLAARLTETPNDAEGWARLLRSYMVLGRPDDARDAYARALEALAGDAEGLAIVAAAAHEAGLETE